MNVSIKYSLFIELPQFLFGMAVLQASVVKDTGPINIVLKFCSLGFVTVSGGFWTGAGVDTRPKYREEQTLIGGAIWTNVLITIGLIISTVSDEFLCVYVHAYLLFSCGFLLIVTSSQLIVGEILKLRKAKRTLVRINSRLQNHQVPSPHVMRKYDKIYLAIGVFMLLASFFIIADFILLLI